jgi:30S ribosomal protein S31
MGKGDRRTKRGKIFRGTFGKSRPRKKKKDKVAQAEKPEQSESAEAKE